MKLDSKLDIAFDHDYLDIIKYVSIHKYCEHVNGILDE